MRYPGAETDPAEPLPRDRVGHLTAHRLEAELVAKLQEHHPQVGLQGDRRSPQPFVEEPDERGEEHRIIQQGVHPTGSTNNSASSNDSHNDG